jgi:hypothetical protein
MEGKNHKKDIYFARIETVVENTLVFIYQLINTNFLFLKRPFSLNKYIGRNDKGVWLAFPSSGK